MKIQKVRLERFQISTYRSCKRTSLLPNDDVTALIGPNGSGKTNLLHGLQLLRDVMSRRPQREDRDGFALASKIRATFRVGKRAVLYQASIVFRPTDKNRDQVVEADEEWNLKDFTGNSEWIHFPDRFRGSAGRRSFSAQRMLVARWASLKLSKEEESVYDLLFNPQADPSRQKSLQRAMDAIADFRGRIKYYSASQFTNPGNCPTSFEVDGDRSLRELHTVQSTDHVRFLYDLYMLHKRGDDLYDTYMSLIDKKGVHLIDKLSWKEVKLHTNNYRVHSGGKILKIKRENTNYTDDICWGFAAFI
jgi:AAA domain, putative AbiEii toxin, Type IV TA system